MYFNRASNALGRDVGTVLISPEGNHCPFTAKLSFDYTNNMAEYEACVMGLQAVIEKKIKKLTVYGDSALVICQLSEEWETGDSKLVPYQEFIKGLIEQFEEITFKHLPREENYLADALATLATMFKVNANAETQLVKLEVRESQAHCACVQGKPDGNPWYHDVLRYIKNQQYSEFANDNDKRTLRRLAMGFFLDGDILYKKSKDQMLLRCVSTDEAKKIVHEIHEGVCGTHASGHVMARQIMRAEYYWMTLENDCISYVRKCHKCQIYADKIHVPPTSLNVMVSPWPFLMWGMDVIGPITPKASNGHHFIFVVIDYFTKWVETTSYASVTEIICRYELPERIISDNGLNLNNDMVT